MYWLSGAVLALKSMVSGLIQRLQDLMSHGASNTSAPIAIGEHKYQVAQDPLQPVPTELKAKPKAARSTKSDQSRKRAPTSAKPKATHPGQPARTVALQHQQLAKQAVKAKQGRAKSIKAVLLSPLEQAAAQTPTASQSGERGQRKTTARKTRQAAK